MAALVAVSLSGCGHHRQARVPTPPPPEIAPAPAPPLRQVPAASLPPVKNVPPTAKAKEPVLTVPADAKPITVQTGTASWYGAPYHNRRSSDGKVYDMNAMTAAHRTFPLGSIVRVTNVKTSHSCLVRITDRGPFIPGRILDLSLAAAKQVDIWQAGIANVRVELLETPTPLNIGGRWAVQIGAFKEQDDANNLADRLTRRYRTAKVLSFSSPVGDWWVRVRVLHDDRKLAQEVAQESRTPEGAIFLVRLD
jgi:rare lipoprotein A